MISLRPANLDYEKDSVYNLTITIVDSYGLTVIEMITLDIVDVNEAPVIHNLPEILKIAEDETGEMVVFTVDATDEDGDVINYTMMTWPPSAPFKINSTGNRRTDTDRHVYTDRH